MEVIQQMLHFALPRTQNFTSHTWLPLCFLFQSLVHSLKFVKTPFNFALPFITNPDHNVASIAPSLPSIDAFIKKFMTSTK
jgi:hypothetical protein